MSRMVRWAARLYPRWWRERYGEEFAALLEDARPDARGAFDVLKGAVAMQMRTVSAKRILLFGGAVGLLSGLVTALVLTPQYASVAVLSLPSGDTTQDKVEQNRRCIAPSAHAGEFDPLYKTVQSLPQ